MSSERLCQSCIAEHVWVLYETDQAEFKRRVQAHFAVGMPGWKVVKANYPKRIIWIQNERRSLV